MMVDLQLTNKKLTERAKRIVMIACDCDYTRAAELLSQAGGHVKTAIVMEKKKVTPKEAIEFITEADGSVKRAIKD
jgi:N-acetylmuramic acid 6-phosphate etherase